jgi:hypothetical protein
VRICASCPVELGLCPFCSTFWTRDEGGKRYGVLRTDHADGHANGPTSGGPQFLNLLPNVVGA